MNNLSIFDKKNRVSDKVLNFFIQASSALSVLILVVCIGYILYRGIPHFDFSYLVNTTSILKGTVGILPNIINTLYIIVGKTLTDPAVNNKAADSATIRPIPKIIPVKIPGIALGNKTVLIIYHLVAPIPKAASR